MINEVHESREKMENNPITAKEEWIDMKCSEGYCTPCQDGCWVVEFGLDLGMMW